MSTRYTFKFAAILTLLVLTTTVAYFVVRSLVSIQEKNTYLISLSGGQIALSQKIVGQSVALAQAKDRQVAKELADDLAVLVEIMENSHNLLTGAHGQVGELLADSPSLRTIYYEAPFHLDQQVRKFLQDTRNLIKAETGHERTTIQQSILAMARGNMPEGLSAAVKEYQEEIGSRIKSLNTLRLAFLVLVYLLLALDAFFVFRPLLRRIEEDETELNRIRTELESSSTRDGLTGLLNRASFKEALIRELAQIKRGGDDVTLILFDIIDFGKVNFQHGDDVGDRLLEELGQLLLNNVRLSDYVFRLAGGRFAVLAAGTDIEGAEILADKLKALMDVNRFHNGIHLKIAVAMAGATPDSEADEMILRAQEALDMVKDYVPSALRK